MLVSVLVSSRWRSSTAEAVKTSFPSATWWEKFDKVKGTISPTGNKPNLRIQQTSSTWEYFLKILTPLDVFRAVTGSWPSRPVQMVSEFVLSDQISRVSKRWVFCLPSKHSGYSAILQVRIWRRNPNNAKSDRILNIVEFCMFGRGNRRCPGHVGGYHHQEEISDSALIICHFNHIERFTEAKGAQVGLCGLVKRSKITCNPWFSTLIPSSTIPLAIFSMLSPSTSLGIIQRIRDHPGRLPNGNLPPFDNLSSPAPWLSIVSPQLLLLSSAPYPSL